MTVLQIVRDAVEDFAAPFEAGDRIIVPILVTYPGGAMLQLTVEGGDRTFVVSDGGGALRCFLAHGGQGRTALRLAGDAAHRYGAKCNANGWIYEANVGRSQLPSALSAVADASLQASKAMLKSLRPANVADFRPLFDRMIRARFEGKVRRDAIFVGASNKKHKFDYQLDLGGSRTVLVDAVVPDPSSINAAIVAHLDVRNRHQQEILQRIVYDDRLAWQSSDLALLGTGATPLAYSVVEANLERIVA